VLLHDSLYSPTLVDYSFSSKHFLVPFQLVVPRRNMQAQEQADFLPIYSTADAQALLANDDSVLPGYAREE
jgi:hypothetical protein